MFDNCFLPLLDNIDAFHFLIYWNLCLLFLFTVNSLWNGLPSAESLYRTWSVVPDVLLFNINNHSKVESPLNRKNCLALRRYSLKEFHYIWSYHSSTKLTDMNMTGCSLQEHSVSINCSKLLWEILRWHGSIVQYCKSSIVNEMLICFCYLPAQSFRKFVNSYLEIFLSNW